MPMVKSPWRVAGTAGEIARRLRGGMNMGRMNDGTECLLCEQWQDLDSADDLDMCCRDCQSEIKWMLARRRAGDE